MYETCNKKLKEVRSNPRLGLQHTNTLGLIIQITANFSIPLESDPTIYLH